MELNTQLSQQLLKNLHSAVKNDKPLRDLYKDSFGIVETILSKRRNITKAASRKEIELAMKYSQNELPPLALVSINQGPAQAIEQNRDRIENHLNRLYQKVFKYLGVTNDVTEEMLEDMILIEITKLTHYFSN